jgi:hypothetical protein
MRLQGRPTPPSDLQAVPLTVKLYTPGGSSPVMTYTVTATSGGNFTISGIVNGTYDVAVKHAQSLTNKKLGVVFSGGTTSVDFGILLLGDANNDDIVDISDFSILRSTYFRLCGQAGFDGRADFNADCIVDVSDFSLLRSNFLRSGPVILSASAAMKLQSAVGGGRGLASRLGDAVTIGLDPDAPAVTVGQIFSVAINVNAGSQQVDGAQAVITFDPVHLQVVDDAGLPVSSITAGSAMDTHLMNQVDNAAGRILYSDGQLAGAPLTGSFTLATICFKAVAAGLTPVSFTMQGQLQTKVTFQGGNVLSSAMDGTVTVAAGPVLSRHTFLPVILLGV